ncbi:Succinyl-CoA synthetase [Desulfurella amilsii]|uniref:Succinyl-CoA synthetase n=1 Tax=Desulfurella amilsii TaxID=1562698 RepID=A0A1X4XXN2_9BACT|nr:CoA-binding protein [Desulfurella amilsii]OSS42291.1 Succinyl-CoA synthetase [Desulfurella amilsii]
MESCRLGFGEISKTDEEIVKKILKMKTIAVVGLSPKPDRPSYDVASYLQAKGYKIVPVRPGVSEILGEKCYATLEDIPFSIDVVDVFRNAKDCPSVVESALKIKPKAIWLQEDIISPESKKMVEGSGILFIMDHCLKKAHQKYIEGTIS